MNCRVFSLLHKFKSSTIKSCDLDPTPAVMLRECWPVIVPVITDIVNHFFDGAIMPEMLKIAQIRPRLKKASLDDDIFKNFRPVSNLAFISKVIEKAVCYQLIEHVDSNDLSEPLQSAYKSLHNTETALLKVQNDTLNAIGQLCCYSTCPQHLTQSTTSFCLID